MRTIPRDEPPSAVTVSSGVMRIGRITGAGARRRAPRVQRRPGGRRPAQGQPAGDPQPAGRARELQRRLIDFSSGLAYAVGGTMSAGRRPGLPAHARPTSRSPRRRRSGCRPAGCTTAELVHTILCRGPHRLHRHPRVAARCCRGFRSVPGRSCAQVNGILLDLTEWALRPMRQIIPPVGMFDVSFMVLFFGLFLLHGASASPHWPHQPQIARCGVLRTWRVTIRRVRR